MAQSSSDKLSAPFTVCVGDFLPELKETRLRSPHGTHHQPNRRSTPCLFRQSSPYTRGSRCAQANYQREYDLFISVRTLDQLFLQNLAEKRAHRLILRMKPQSLLFARKIRLFESAFPIGTSI